MKSVKKYMLRHILLNKNVHGLDLKEMKAFESDTWPVRLPLGYKYPLVMATLDFSN